MVHSHTGHLPLGALLIWCAMCGTGFFTFRLTYSGATSTGNNGQTFDDATAANPAVRRGTWKQQNWLGADSPGTIECLDEGCVEWTSGPTACTKFVGLSTKSDNAVFDGVDSGCWSYAVGAMHRHKGGMPGPRSYVADAVTLEIGTGRDWSAEPVALVDMDDDKKADLVELRPDGWYVSLSDGTTFAAAEKWSPASWTSAGVAHDLITVGDVNGDGKGDVVEFLADGVYAMLSTGTGLEDAVAWSSNTDLAQLPGRALADVNGDRFADLVAFGTDGVRVALSSGSSFGASEEWHGAIGTSGGVKAVADVDGDGKADLVDLGADETLVARSTGSSFGESKVWASHPRTQESEGDLVASGQRCAPALFLGKFHADPLHCIPEVRADPRCKGRYFIHAAGNDHDCGCVTADVDCTEERNRVADEHVNTHLLQPHGSSDQNPRALGDVSGLGRASVVTFVPASAVSDDYVPPTPTQRGNGATGDVVFAGRMCWPGIWLKLEPDPRECGELVRNDPRCKGRYYNHAGGNDNNCGCTTTDVDCTQFTTTGYQPDVNVRVRGSNPHGQAHLVHQLFPAARSRMWATLTLPPPPPSCAAPAGVLSARAGARARATGSGRDELLSW